jgi:hypothetical protein
VEAFLPADLGPYRTKKSVRRFPEETDLNSTCGPCETLSYDHKKEFQIETQAEVYIARQNRKTHSNG